MQWCQYYWHLANFSGITFRKIAVQTALIWFKDTNVKSFTEFPTHTSNYVLGTTFTSSGIFLLLLPHHRRSRSLYNYVISGAYTKTTQIATWNNLQHLQACRTKPDSLCYPCNLLWMQFKIYFPSHITTMGFYLSPYQAKWRAIHKYLCVFDIIKRKLLSIPVAGGW